MAQMPVPGDVDVVIASELMEAGRAMLRGFSTPDRTVLIASTHRIYAVSEKAAMGDGRGDANAVIEATARHAKRFIGFDMEDAAQRSNSVISSVLFGALASSGTLPFERAAFESAIREGGIAVESNLRGFHAGFRAALPPPQADLAENPGKGPQPTTDTGGRLQRRIFAELPEPAWGNAHLGVQRLMDYQNGDYASLYLDRLGAIAEVDRQPHRLSAELARHLALWMSYEDVIRVADLKTRLSRLRRVRQEVQANQGHRLAVTEFMHPRLREICDILPARIGLAVLRSPVLTRLLARFFRAGRQVETTALPGFLLLWLVSGLRVMRPRSLRYAEEQDRIEEWVTRILTAARLNIDFAVELVLCQRLIKGYGDTFDRGMANFRRLMEATDGLDPTRERSISTVRRLRDLALADEEGSAFGAEVGQVSR
jgi:indolepyruvate ferredoxin oxidoreductase beta subunit